MPCTDRHAPSVATAPSVVPIQPLRALAPRKCRRPRARTCEKFAKLSYWLPPISVLTYALTARGVAADTAATLVISAARSLADAELLAVQRDVERAIALGAYPLEAVTRGFGFSLDAANPTTTGETGTTQTIAPKTPRKP